MRVLVTGGMGFIGYHLVERLMKDGNEVVVIDIKSGLNILDDDSGKLFKDVDVVYHLAALTRPQESILDPVEFNRTNVEGTLKVLMHCRDHKVKRLVFASTTAQYGEQTLLPTPETVTANPMSPYALQKLLGEHYCKLFEKMYGMEINIIRPFNVYGVGQSLSGSYAAAVPKFMDMLSKGETPYITGNGNQSRDFIYVDDVVDLMIIMANSKIYGEAFNAGSGRTTSINELYRIISFLMNKGDVEPDYVDPVFEPYETQGDISKAKKLLGWEPKISLEEGLKRTVEGTLNGSNN